MDWMFEICPTCGPQQQGYKNTEKVNDRRTVKVRTEVREGEERNGGVGGLCLFKRAEEPP